MEIEPNSIYKFSKSYSERYHEYCSILIDEDNSERFSMREKWSMYLEIGMNRSSHGWRAYWNILRTYCDGLDISFPKVVQVLVINVNYENLSADVSIINSSDDDELNYIPSEIEAVPLKDLYVATSQEIPGDLDVVAECLDQLRFFYHHLWWPWVDDESEKIQNNESADWAADHLENRLKLYFDKLKMPYTLAKKITRYVEKCKETYNNLQTNEDMEPMLVNRLQNELNRMKVELNQLCIPEIRELEYEKVNVKSLIIALQENEILTVYTYLCEALEKLREPLVPEKLDEFPIKLVSPDLEECLLNYDMDDTILVTPGRYELDYMEYFDFPVVIKGSRTSNSSERITITDKRSLSSIFQFLATTVKINNVHFQLNFSRVVFSVKRGTLVLYHVRFNNLIVKDTIAIQLLKDTKLVAIGCQFENFNEAIVCQQGAAIELVDCTFQENHTCIKFVDGVKLTMQNCELKSSKKGAPFIYEDYSNNYCSSDEEEMERRDHESLDFFANIPGVRIGKIKVDDETEVVKVLWK